MRRSLTASEHSCDDKSLHGFCRLLPRPESECSQEDDAPWRWFGFEKKVCVNQIAWYHCASVSIMVAAGNLFGLHRLSKNRTSMRG